MYEVMCMPIGKRIDLMMETGVGHIGKVHLIHLVETGVGGNGNGALLVQTCCARVPI